MKYECYEDVKFDISYSTFDFISEGHNGSIQKRIEFAPTQWPTIYNLAFGDIKENGLLDDLTISNNGDRNKILATIFKIIDTYTNEFPERWIYFEGSTVHRTRLYRMAVTLHLEELSLMYEILADTTGQKEFVRFQKGLNIKAFLIKRKCIKFDT
jgi:hypothetical protein